MESGYSIFIARMATLHQRRMNSWGFPSATEQRGHFFRYRMAARNCTVQGFRQAFVSLSSGLMIIKSLLSRRLIRWKGLAPSLRESASIRTRTFGMPPFPLMERVSQWFPDHWG